jgi:hypothetical protein
MRVMILTQFGLRRYSISHRRLVIGILLALGSAGVVLGSNWDRAGANRAWNDATSLRDALSQSVEPSREAYLKCIRTYQLVYKKDPHFISSGEAIFHAGLATSMITGMRSSSIGSSPRTMTDISSARMRSCASERSAKGR